MYDVKIGKHLYQKAHEERQKLNKFNYMQGITYTIDIDNKHYECENKYIQYLVQAVAFDEPSAANELASILENAAIVMKSNGDDYRKKAKACREKSRRLQKANVNKNSMTRKYSIATSSSSLLNHKNSTVQYNYSFNSSPSKTTQSNSAELCKAWRFLFIQASAKSVRRLNASLLLYCHFATLLC